MFRQQSQSELKGGRHLHRVECEEVFQFTRRELIVARRRISLYTFNSRREFTCRTWLQDPIRVDGNAALRTAFDDYVVTQKYQVMEGLALPPSPRQPTLCELAPVSKPGHFFLFKEQIIGSFL